MSWGIGIDLGGTNVKAVAVTSGGDVLGRNSAPTRDGVGTIEDWADAARLAISTFVRERGSEPAAVGMCMPGLVAAGGRSIASYPGRLRGLEGFDWPAALNRPRVPLLNDAHAALLAEAWLGAARGRRHAILLTLGTGVGGAILADGRLLRGALGRAGHLGHLSVDQNGPASIVGMPGAIEMMIGECTLLERGSGRYADTRTLVAAHWAGDDEASRIWLESVRALACAIASAINILDPEIVVLGGGIAKAGEALFRPLYDELATIEWRPTGEAVPVVPAALGEWAGALGAARHALFYDESR